MFLWVDDLLAVEPDIGNRLDLAERHLRWAVTSVFGGAAWNHDKHEPWSHEFVSLGLLWNTERLTVSIPAEKVARVKTALATVMNRKRLSNRDLNKIIGTLRHVKTFIPQAAPWLNGLQDLQRESQTSNWVSVSRQTAQDLKWWRSLIVSNSFEGIPLQRFRRLQVFDILWKLTVLDNVVELKNLETKDIIRVKTSQNETALDMAGVEAVLTGLRRWKNKESTRGEWQNVAILVPTSQWVNLLGKCRTSCTDLRDLLFRLTEQSVQASVWIHALVESKRAKPDTTQHRSLKIAACSSCQYKLTLSQISRTQDESLPGTQWQEPVTRKGTHHPPQQRTPGTSDAGKVSVGRSIVQNISTISPRVTKQKLSRCSPRIVSTKETRRAHSQERWQPSGLCTKRTGTRTSRVTMIRNWSSSYKDLNSCLRLSRVNSPMIRPCSSVLRG